MDGYLERFLEFGCEGFDLGVFIKNGTIDFSFLLKLFDYDF